MNKALAEELTQSVGQSTSGAWRTIAALKTLGVPKALGLTEEEWLKKYLGNYVQLAVSERYDTVVTLRAAGLKNDEIAKAADVDPTTIRRLLKKKGKIARVGRPKGKKSQRKQDMDGATLPHPLTEIAAVAITAEQQAEIGKDRAKTEAAAQSRARREASQSALPSTAFDFREGDARSVLADVPSDSVHLILTDPPYGDEAEPLYRWLAEWAQRVLVDGGSLICFTGQSRLDRDMRIFAKHLRWWWLLAMRHNQSQRLPGKFVMAEFKPVLWFVKKHRRGRTLVNDVLRSDRREKDGHDWGQGDGGIELLVQQLTDPVELVADPFAGTGRWGEIAVRMGRAWIGADVVRGGDSVVVA
jgi:site-specific DNA-methyltransferase (adenine-specific)